MAVRHPTASFGLFLSWVTQARSDRDALSFVRSCRDGRAGLPVAAVAVKKASTVVKADAPPAAAANSASASRDGGGGARFLERRRATTGSNLRLPDIHQPRSCPTSSSSFGSSPSASSSVAGE
jgi:hypothetical protein